MKLILVQYERNWPSLHPFQRWASPDNTIITQIWWDFLDYLHPNQVVYGDLYRVLYNRERTGMTQFVPFGIVERFQQLYQKSKILLFQGYNRGRSQSCVISGLAVGRRQLGVDLFRFAITQSLAGFLLCLPVANIIIDSRFPITF